MTRKIIFQILPRVASRSDSVHPINHNISYFCRTLYDHSALSLPSDLGRWHEASLSTLKAWRLVDYVMSLMRLAASEHTKRATQKACCDGACRPFCPWVNGNSASSGNEGGRVGWQYCLQQLVQLPADQEEDGHSHPHYEVPCLPNPPNHHPSPALHHPSFINAEKCSAILTRWMVGLQPLFVQMCSTCLRAQCSPAWKSASRSHVLMLQSNCPMTVLAFQHHFTSPTTSPAPSSSHSLHPVSQPPSDLVAFLLRGHIHHQKGQFIPSSPTLHRLYVSCKLSWPFLSLKLPI